jgi:FkbM family methyltransferase
MWRSIKQKVKQQLYAAKGLRAENAIAVHIVNPGDQAWTIASDSLRPGAIVCSLGLADNVEFDLNLIRDFGSEVHGFDPTPASVEWIQSQELPPEFHHHAVAVAGHDGILNFSLPDPGMGGCASAHLVANAGTVAVPCKRISTLMRDLGHDHIDLLKMDIEGTEYEVIDEILSKQIRVDQILVEFHHRFPGIGMEKTLSAVAALRSAGYQLFHVSPWCEEYAFIKKC